MVFVNFNPVVTCGQNMTEGAANEMVDTDKRNA
jgi:hypothetical protein